MNRRNFISTLLGAGAGLALEEAVPFGRVWFFPQKVRIANLAETNLHRLYREGVLGKSWGFDWHAEMTLNVGEVFTIPQIAQINPRTRKDDEIFRVIDASKDGFLTIG
jgi:hypothetical protein